MVGICRQFEIRDSVIALALILMMNNLVIG